MVNHFALLCLYYRQTMQSPELSGRIKGLLWVFKSISSATCTAALRAPDSCAGGHFITQQDNFYDYAAAAEIIGDRSGPCKNQPAVTFWSALSCRRASDPVSTGTVEITTELQQY